jgi:hypothetical protein
VRVRFAPEALEAIRHNRAWWEAHRDKAPRLFRDELADVIAKLRTGATEGAQLYTVHAKRKIWRVLMPKTKVHVYYRASRSGQEVEIVTTWNATAGDGPDFSSF